MIDPDLAASWRRTESHLREAAALMRGTTPAVNAELAELLDHDELGLSLDLLVAAAVDQNAGEAFWSTLHSAVAEMAFDELDATHGASVRVVREHVPPDLP